MDNYTLHIVRDEPDIELFWRWRDRYMREDILPNATFDPATDEECEWFFSQEYRDHMMEAFYREKHPLRIVFLQNNGENIGFAVYVIYHAEDGKCQLVDFNVNEGYRDRGIGTMFFRMLSEHVLAEHAAYFSLNISNELNQRFWMSNGFVRAGKDEHGADVYEKRPI